jgi:hypothetical protein
MARKWAEAPLKKKRKKEEEEEEEEKKKRKKKKEEEEKKKVVGVCTAYFCFARKGRTFAYEITTLLGIDHLTFGIGVFSCCHQSVSCFSFVRSVTTVWRMR